MSANLNSMNELREVSTEELQSVHGGSVLGFVVEYIATKVIDAVVSAVEGNSGPRQIVDAAKNIVDGKTNPPFGR
jgi:hypothetical protein